MSEQNDLKREVTKAVRVIVTVLLLQIGTLAWWAGAISARMTNVEGGLEKMATRVHALETSP